MANPGGVIGLMHSPTADSIILIFPHAPPTLYWNGCGLIKRGCGRIRIWIIIIIIHSRSWELYAPVSNPRSAQLYSFSETRTQCCDYSLNMNVLGRKQLLSVLILVVVILVLFSTPLEKARHTSERLVTKPVAIESSVTAEMHYSFVSC